MSELPGRPNLDQLRRQARELLRAAADGEPAALARVRAFSERVSLSAAQLAVAREYGFEPKPAGRPATPPSSRPWSAGTPKRRLPSRASS